MKNTVAILILLSSCRSSVVSAFLPSSKSRCNTFFHTNHYVTKLHASSTKDESSASIAGTSATATVTVTAKNEEIQQAVYCKSFGGNIQPIRLENEDDNFLSSLSVPTYAAFSCSTNKTNKDNDNDEPPPPKRMGMEALVPGAFILQNALSSKSCEEMIRICESSSTATNNLGLGFGQFNAGKNNHGALQIVVTQEVADELCTVLSPHVDLSIMREHDLKETVLKEQNNNNNDDDDEAVDKKEQLYDYNIAGINRRWRVYRYEPGGIETFAPHIDAGFPPSSLSKDNTTLIWDASTSTTTSIQTGNGGKVTDQTTPQQMYGDNVVSRMTVLMYLNDDFNGGQTNFYTPVMDGPPPPSSSSSSSLSTTSTTEKQPSLLASVKPKTGSVLVFPQAIGEDAVDYARLHWPLHEGSPVLSDTTGTTRPKYVIRSDILFEKVPIGGGSSSDGDDDDDDNSKDGIFEDPKFWKHDDAVRETFTPNSPMMNPLFKNHIASLYNPHMGVEHVGALLYSFVRFAKIRKVVEIGAGYTTLWILQALKDNDDEMNKIRALGRSGQCLLMDIPWAVPNIVEQYHIGDESSLLCIDNCLHQKETATGAGAIAKTLGLDPYLQFVKGDAFDMKFESESVDLLWCDFGVGRKMKEFASSSWDSIRPGGFLICHSTLTNRGTRNWLEAVRNGASVEETGIPPEEVVELSLLEPQKYYQNSISILQKRKGSSGESYEEPIYSEYA